MGYCRFKGAFGHHDDYTEGGAYEFKFIPATASKEGYYKVWPEPAWPSYSINHPISEFRRYFRIHHDQG